MQKRLPPLTALRHFEAAARHLSFKKAADELAVSPAAVTHQIKVLEWFFATPLFHRETRQVGLTEAGEKLARAASQAFRDLAETVQEIAGDANPQFVTVKLGRYIGARWLSPRLRDFWSGHSAVDLRLHHSTNEQPDDPADVDLAILWGDGNWPHHTVEPLIALKTVALCAPGMLRTASRFLARLEKDKKILLHYRDHESWREWLASAGLDPAAARSGQVFDDANVVIEAAIAGQGITLGYLPVSEVDLRDGRLVPAHAHHCDAAFGYYLVYRPRVLERPAVAAFRDWLRRQAAGAGAVTV